MTSVGVADPAGLLTVPSPTWPLVSRPQQNSSPVVLVAQLWWLPALTLAQSVAAPMTSVGVADDVGLPTVPSPSSPLLSLPQQKSRPAVVIPQLWLPPDTTCFQSTLPPAAAGSMATMPTVPDASATTATVSEPILHMIAL